MKHKIGPEQEAYLSALEKENEALKEEIHALKEEIQEYHNFLRSLAKTIENKDGYHRSQVDRTTLQALELGRAVGLSESDLLILKKVIWLRDIGKIKVPSAILNKPGKLTEEENELIKKHPQFGAEILAEVRGTHLHKLIEGIQGHHERVDGKGYPSGKRDQELSLIAKITAVVDFWNAIVSDRPYRKTLPLSEALSLIKVVAGSHLDADLVKVFVEKKIYSLSVED